MRRDELEQARAEKGQRRVTAGRAGASAEAWAHAPVLGPAAPARGQGDAPVHRVHRLRLRRAVRDADGRHGGRRRRSSRALGVGQSRVLLSLSRHQPSTRPSSLERSKMKLQHRPARSNETDGASRERPVSKQAARAGPAWNSGCFEAGEKEWRGCRHSCLCARLRACRVGAHAQQDRLCFQAGNGNVKPERHTLEVD